MNRRLLKIRRHVESWGVMILAALVVACRAPAYRGPVSPHFDGERFHNEPAAPHPGFWSLLGWQLTSDRIAWPDWVDWRPGQGPTKPPATVGDDVRVTWVNHSTMLIQMHGVNILTDPVWSTRVGPASWLGPRRHHDPGVRFEDLPHIDAVLISHDHYDHLDLPTLERLVARDTPTVFAGLGSGSLLESAGVRPHVELDWWECRAVGQARVCALPAQHNGRRGLSDGNRRLWVSYWVETASGSVYFAGDTGFGPHFERIRERMGAPCVALLSIGAYLPRWFMANNHMAPVDAVRAHDVLGAQTSIAMHFATFEQSDEGMYQPAGDLRRALALGTHAPFVVPEFGEERAVACRTRRSVP
jgi:L-ascorbate metabolism protein UlaG (beta-lactamase superfamily)